MKMARKRNQAGFSLVELMIVVAIIGILATIAVPNFRKFQGRARQSEAKANLAAMYSAQKAFYAEWSFYHGDLRDIGFRPEGQQNYVVGMAGVTTATLPTNYNNSTAGGGTVATLAANSCINSMGNTTYPGPCNGGNFAPHVTAGTLVINGPAMGVTAAVGTGTGGCEAFAAPTATAFTAQAAGKPNPDTTRADVWRIDTDKSVCNAQDGLI